MIFLFGGVPSDIHERFLTAARRQLSKAKIISIPKGSARCPGESVTPDHIDVYLDTLIRYLRIGGDWRNDGLCVVLVFGPYDNEALADRFFPFAMTDYFSTKDFNLLSRPDARTERTRIIDDAIALASALRSSVKTFGTELASNRNRTPFMLPLKHFEENDVVNLLTALLRAARGEECVSSAIERLRRAFEGRHRTVSPSGRSRAFVNSRDVVFHSPGRALHGVKYFDQNGGHGRECFFNGTWRLGGSLPDGFHYDCIKEKSDGYSGRFENCHGEQSDYKGKPHLNVYPNDYIRE